MFQPYILLERYRVEAELGHGGQGAVYLARHLLLDVPVAIKELTLRSAPVEPDESVLRQFQVEGRILCQLRHPALPRVQDFFEADGKYYLVMDYIDGGTMADTIHQQGPQPIDKVSAWALALCDVLAYLHSQQPPIIFRDLKPQNIMLDNHGQLKLIDFGIAKVLDPSSGSGTTQTEGRRAGTPGYAAIEQYSAGTDVRTDVYALGATLYCLLEAVPPPPSPELAAHVKTIAPLGSHVPAPLAATILQMLRLRPDERPQSMEEVRQLLTRPPLPTKKTLAEPGTAGSRRPWMKRPLPASVEEPVPETPIPAADEPIPPGASVVHAATIMQAVTLPQALAAFNDACLREDWTTAVLAANQVRRQPDYERSAESLALLADLSCKLPRDTFAQAWFVCGLFGHEGPVRSIRILTDQRSVLTGGADGTLRRWDLPSGQCVASWTEHLAPIVTVHVTEDRATAMTLDAEGIILLWNLSDGKVVSRKKAGARAAALADNGRYMVWGGPGGLSMVEVPGGRHLRTLQVPCTAVAMTPDGRRVAAAGPDGTVVVWSVATGTRQHTLVGHTAPVRAIAFGGDGRYLLSSSDDHTLRVYEAPTFSFLHALEGHTGPVTDVAVSADGNVVVSSAINGDIRIWDLRLAACVQTLSLGGAVAVSPLGNLMLAGDLSGALYLWAMDWRVLARDRVAWDDAVQPVLENFVMMYRLTPDALDEVNYDALMQALSLRGYGWLERTAVVDALRATVRAMARRR